MKRIHVVAAVIRSAKGVLIARRPDHLHQGGKWEFPGGKVESNEVPWDALVRELHEELDIVSTHGEPLIKIAHDYPDKSVLLDVWMVDGFQGQPRGVEGQEIRWVEPDELAEYQFPAANRPIVSAAQLPRRYVITPELEVSVEHFLARIRELIQAQLQCFQIRTKAIDGYQWRELVAGLAHLKQQYPQTMFLLNSAVPAAQVPSGLFAGIHYTAKDLSQLKVIPECWRSPGKWTAASCHTWSDLIRAQELGISFATLSPYNVTASHPAQPPIDRRTFEQWVAQSKIPLFALGGLGEGDYKNVIAIGAQGFAGIRCFWDHC